MKINFAKMHGLGNDFILIDYIKKEFLCDDNSYLSYFAKNLCDRNFGIGADGIIFILPSNQEDLKMRIFNSDGSEAQMCGNGIRCFAKYVYENKIIQKKKFTVETLAGTITPELVFKNLEGEEITGIKVDMGIPKLTRKEIPMLGKENFVVINETLRVNPDYSVKVTCVSMGNPHCIIFVDNVQLLSLQEIGPQIENNQLFPERTNVEFVQIINEREIKVRVWERGAGETLACGTGACAALVAAALNKKTKRKAIVHLPGGDLDIQWRNNKHIYMIGPANLVFTGEMII